MITTRSIPPVFLGTLAPLRRLVATAGLVSAAAFVGAPSALAGDFVCTAIASASGRLDNVVVPPGERCDMFDATVKGSVKVYGSLNVFGQTSIRGSVYGKPGHGSVTLFGDGVRVRGNVQIKGATGGEFGDSGGYTPGTQIGGDFQWEKNTAPLLAFEGTHRRECQGEEEHRRRRYRAQHHWGEHRVQKESSTDL